MKIRRSNLLDVVHEALGGKQTEQSPQERLIAERDERQRQWRGHVHSYLSVNAGLFVMNLVMAVLSGQFVPWFVFPLLGWGISVGIHTLNHRGWLYEHRVPIAAAEATLGIAAPSTVPLLTSGPLAPPDDDPWPALLAACEDAVARARSLIGEVHPAAIDAVADLKEGLNTIERLADGAERIQSVLDGLAPGGRDGLDGQIANLDRRINATDDEALRDAHLANRALLLARRAKIDALRADQARMLAKAQGFLLAVENLHLDAARLGGPDEPDALSEPIHRLTEEVQILRQVDHELKRMS